MPVDDLWYLTRRDAQGRRVRSARHGRGRRWRVRWSDPITGAARSVAFDTRRDADRHDTAVRHEIATSTYLDHDAARQPLADYAAVWHARQLHNPATAARIETGLRRHVLSGLGDRPLSSLRPGHLQQWVTERSRVLAASTVATLYHGIVVPLFAAAVSDRILATSPATGITLPRRDAGDYYLPTAVELSRLVAALPEHYRTAVWTAAGTGLRFGELFGLDAADLDLQTGYLRVRRQLAEPPGQRPQLTRPKTAASRRTVELPAPLVAALAAHLETHAPPADEHGHRPIFTTKAGGPVTRSAWSQAWRPARAAAGLPPGYGIHGLRHYYATALIYGGAPVGTVQRALGHTSAETTLRIYLGHWPTEQDTVRTLVTSTLGGLLQHSTVEDPATQHKRAAGGQDPGKKHHHPMTGGDQQ